MAIHKIHIAQVHEDGDVEISHSTMSPQVASLNGYVVLEDLGDLKKELTEYGVDEDRIRDAFSEMRKGNINDWVKV